MGKLKVPHRSTCVVHVEILPCFPSRLSGCQMGHKVLGLTNCFVELLPVNPGITLHWHRASCQVLLG